MRVWAIPLASKGFMSVSESNPVFWYLENLETGKLLTLPFPDRKSAEDHAKAKGWELEEGLSSK